MNDTASEMAYPLLPLFLVGTLGAGPAFLGIVEGIAETTASLGKLGGGFLSDRIGRRKALVVGGYGLAIEYLGSIIQRGIDEGSFRPVDARVAASTLLATLDGLLFQSALGLTVLEEPGLPEKICEVYLRGLVK